MPVKKAKFAMAFHCYQPVSNFDGMIERVYRRAYLPLLGALEGFPGIKASFHMSGNLLEWLEERHPEYIKKLARMVAVGQIEIIGGGCFEPVMAIIPERDRAGQLRLNSETVSRMFGIRPRGAWIAERVWEPALADTLSGAGAEYTIVDDHHLLSAGVDGEKIYAPCLTRGEKGEVVLFPSLMDLRYAMPFRSPEWSLEHMRSIADGRRKVSCFFFADDGEKFGAWPHTYNWVYRRGWLRNFLTMLEKNRDWLETATYSEVMDTVPAEEIGSVPASSYAEMMEWSGGDFMNFMDKYPEADRMRRRMLSVSDKIERADRGATDLGQKADITAARKELFKAQAGCAYWHGTFGGVYLPHLRQGVYRHLIKADDIIDPRLNSDKGRVSVVEHDLGGAKREMVLSNGCIGVFLASAGGAVTELDHIPSNVNLVNTMSRVTEKYHDKLSRDYGPRLREARRAVVSGKIANIHDVLGVGERGLRKVLFYDDYRRGCFLTHVFRDRMAWRDMRKGHVSHTGFLKGRYDMSVETGKGSVSGILVRKDRAFMDNARPFDLEVEKRVALKGDSAVEFTQRITKLSGGPLSLRYGVEFNFLIWDRAVMRRDRSLRTDRFSLKDRYTGLRMDFMVDSGAMVYMYPLYTVNETESGLRKTFQGVSLILGREISIGAGGAVDEMRVRMTTG